MLFEHLARVLAGNPRALQTEDRIIPGQALLDSVDTFTQVLERHRIRRLGLLLDNEPAWVTADLAALAAGIVLVPVPGFFSPAQRRHLIRDAGLDAVLAPQAMPDASARLETELGILNRFEPQQPTPLPPGTAKITYTSGTTGKPKGVCLSQANLLAVSRALHEATTLAGIERHLCLLPLALLLENLAGLYVPWLSGASVILEPMHRLGVRGASGIDAPTMLNALSRLQPQSLILVPALLPVVMAGRRRQLPDRYRFLALGGGRTAERLQQQARALGLPLYEGYGLSEAASVVAMNRPGDSRPGTVGRVLPHVEVRIGAGNEVQVRGNSFLGYLGEPPVSNDGWLATGDRGRLDSDGHLSIEGRCKATIVTAMGRNVAPEWLEAEFCALPGVQQAYVYGDEVRGIGALVVTDSHDPEQLRSLVNRHLPDYARVGAIRTTTAPFTTERQELTANGRLRRQALAQRLKETPWDFSTV
ncbi:AMP-binding protein [Marinobacterium aestuariivivens]|uniref:AMP-binding protein n=1 Tax=Marinobacterium aestuariivivens TaxID=1698799 RepID=A0ABW2A1T4_9GAMM